MLLTPRIQRSLSLIYALTTLAFAYATALLLFPSLTLRGQLPDHHVGSAPWPELLLIVVVTVLCISTVWTWHSIASAVSLGRVALWLGWALYGCILVVALFPVLFGSMLLGDSSLGPTLYDIAASFWVVLLRASYGLPLVLLCVATAITWVVRRQLRITGEHRRST